MSKKKDQISNEQLRNAARQISNELAEMIDRELCVGIKALEGFDVTNEMIVMFGKKLNHKDGRIEYRWKNEAILVAHPPTMDDKNHVGCRIDRFWPAILERRKAAEELDEERSES